MNLQEYTAARTVAPFGLRNGGVLCYFNTMMQMLLSCPAFGAWLERYVAAVEGGHREEVTPHGLAIARGYLRLLSDMRQRYAQRAGDPESDGGVLETQAHDLFALVADSGSIIHRGQQEDMQEGLIAFLNSIDPQADTVFRVRHTCYIVCTRCDRVHTSGLDGEGSGEGDGPRSEAEGSSRGDEGRERSVNPPNIFMDVCGERFREQAEVEEHVRCYKLFPEGYRCERCGAKNTRREPSLVYQQYSLARLSEVLVLKFGDYGQKRERWFPEELSFPNREGGTFSYGLVSMVLHEGSCSGGHYYAYCLRPKIPHYHRERGSRLSAQLRESERRGDRAAAGLLRAKLELNEQQAAEALGVFKLDDSGVSHAPSGFGGSPYLYYAVYHLFPPAQGAGGKREGK
jgi:hypothetical protein